MDSNRGYLDLPCHAFHVAVDVPRYIALAAVDVHMALTRDYGFGVRSSLCQPQQRRFRSRSQSDDKRDKKPLIDSDLVLLSVLFTSRFSDQQPKNVQFSQSGTIDPCLPVPRMSHFS